MLGDDCPLKAFILVWNKKKGNLVGLIHLDQVSMVCIITTSVLM